MICENKRCCILLFSFGEKGLGFMMSTNLQAYRIVTSSNKRYRPTEIGELIIAILTMFICLDNEIGFGF